MVARVAILVSLWTINLILFFHMVWGEGGILVYRDLKRTYASLEQEIARIDGENLALSREIRLFYLLPSHSRTALHSQRIRLAALPFHPKGY